ncbi:MAG: hypothetical protein U0893_03930 [Chloroflexota bacterium]
MLRIGLIAVLLVGLAVTTPVVCICAPSDHVGIAVHPLFPHTHESDIPHPGHVEAGSESEEDRSYAPSAPSLTVQFGAGTSPFATGSAVDLGVTPPWRITLMLLGRASVPPIVPVLGDRRPPPGPPPR